MDKDELRQIFEAVKANHATLEGCGGPHDFEPFEWKDGTKDFVRKHKCKKCGGIIDSLDVIWYHKGLKHAAKKARSMKRKVVIACCDDVEAIHKQQRVCEDIATAIEGSINE